MIGTSKDIVWLAEKCRDIAAKTVKQEISFQAIRRRGRAKAKHAKEPHLRLHLL